MLDEIVAKFSDAHFLAMLFAAIGSAATVLTAAMPWLQPDTLSRRIKAVSSERERIRARERERLQASQSKGTLRVKPTRSHQAIGRNTQSVELAQHRKGQNAIGHGRVSRRRGGICLSRLSPRRADRLFPRRDDLSVSDHQVEPTRDGQDRHRGRSHLPRHQGARAVPEEQDQQAAEGTRARVSQHLGPPARSARNREFRSNMRCARSVRKLASRASRWRRRWGFWPPKCPIWPSGGSRSRIWA